MAHKFLAPTGAQDVKMSCVRALPYSIKGSESFLEGVLQGELKRELKRELKSKQASKQVSKEACKQASKQAGKQVSRQATSNRALRRHSVGAMPCRGLLFPVSHSDLLT